MRTDDIYDDASKIQAGPLGRCVYCGSTDLLSDEHVVPFALGGTMTIPKGSCEVHRKTSGKFEEAVLRGPMRYVRFVAGFPSRTRHRDLPDRIEVPLAKGAQEFIVEVPPKEAPILLPFPIFELPNFNDPNGRLLMRGVAFAHWGVEEEEFCRRHGADRVSIPIPEYDGVAFARMVAKIAYGAAHLRGVLEHVRDGQDLVNAIMNQPELVGRFVGTLEAPFEKSDCLTHMIEFGEIQNQGLLFAKVQLFAKSAAPTYVVILGRRA